MPRAPAPRASLRRAPLLAPALVVLALALAPAAAACHPGLGAFASSGVVVLPGGPALARLWLYPLCEGPVTVTLDWAAPGAGRETIRAHLDILAPKADCIHLGCGGSDPFAAALRLTAPHAGLDLAGAFAYPHLTAGFAFAGTVHGGPAAFGAAAA